MPSSPSADMHDEYADQGTGSAPEHSNIPDARGNQPESPPFCVNLCDMIAGSSEDGNDVFRLCQQAVAQADEQAALNRFGLNAVAERIYVGSYFCDQLFLSFDDAFFAQVASFCRACNVKATLVLPIFAQSTLARGIERIDNLLDSYYALFDEVTVNDYGMATRLAREIHEGSVADMTLNWGRLFMREQRDPRHMETSYGVRPCIMDATALADLRQHYPLGIVELDPFSPVIDVSPIGDAAPFALHLPHCFMSTGHICEAASATCEPEHSFRPNMTCTQECRRSFTVSRIDAEEIGPTGRACYLVKSGRTVFFENPQCRIEGGPAPARIIWNPETFACTLPEEPVHARDEESWGGPYASGSSQGAAS